MATLSGQTIANTFDSLLHVEDDTAGLVATSTDSRVIQDGVGAASALALATDSVRITSTNKLYFNDVGGEYISGDGTDLTITSGNDIKLAVGAAGSVHSGGSAGTSNTVLGVDAGAELHGSSDFNVFIGDTVADATMTATADYNVGVGYGALGALTTGTQNVVVGASAGAALLAGGNNVAIGMEAFQDADSTSSCVIIGKKAGADINGTAANGTIAIGLDALKLLTSGARNLAIGTYAADALLTSSDNLAIGYGALGSATTNTTQNVAIGNYALDSLTAGETVTDNVAIGYSTGTAVTTGDGNTLVGMQAGKAINTGSKNVIIGWNAGDALTTGDDNILIGRDVAMSGIGVSSEIVIGVGATGQGEHTVTLGNSDCIAVHAAEDSGAVLHCGEIRVGGVDSGAGLNTPSFSVYFSASQDINHATWTKLVWGGLHHETAAAVFDTTNSKFVVPSGEGGKYLMSLHARVDTLDDGEDMILSFYVDTGSGMAGITSRLHQHSWGIKSNTANVSNQVTMILDLNAGDEVEAWSAHNEGGAMTYAANHCRWDCFKLAGIAT